MRQKRLVPTRFSHQMIDMACRFGRGEHIYVLFQHQTVNIFISLDLQQSLDSHNKSSGTNKPCTVELTDTAFFARSKQSSLGDATSTPSLGAVSRLIKTSAHISIWQKEQSIEPDHHHAIIISCAQAWKKPMKPIPKKQFQHTHSKTKDKGTTHCAHYIWCFIIFGYFHCFI